MNTYIFLLFSIVNRGEGRLLCVCVCGWGWGGLSRSNMFFTHKHIAFNHKPPILSDRHHVSLSVQLSVPVEVTLGLQPDAPFQFFCLKNCSPLLPTPPICLSLPFCLPNPSPLPPGLPQLHIFSLFLFLSLSPIDDFVWSDESF